MNGYGIKREEEKFLQVNVLTVVIINVMIDGFVHAALEKARPFPFLEKYNFTNGSNGEINDDVFSSNIDYQMVVDDDKHDDIYDILLTDTDYDTDTDINEFRLDLLTPSVQLSPGHNKYI